MISNTLGIDVYKLIESQGLVAVLLVFLIIRQDRRIDQLLNKICTLQHFIMKCFEAELEEDRK